MSIEIPQYNKYENQEINVDPMPTHSNDKQEQIKLLKFVKLMLMAQVVSTLLLVILVIVLFSVKTSEKEVELISKKAVAAYGISNTDATKIILDLLSFSWANLNVPNSIESKINTASVKALEMVLSQEGQFRSEILNDVHSLISGSVNLGFKPVLRYAQFSTYSQGFGWIANPNLFGGVSPSSWSDGSATANQISMVDSNLNSLFNKKAYPGFSGLICSDEWYHYSSTNGNFCGVLIRVNNTNTTPVSWNLSFYLTSYSAWSEAASVSLNGVLINTYPDANPSILLHSTMALPSNMVSRIIIMSGSSSPSTTRTNVLGFSDDCLMLPSGVKYIDE